MRQSKKERGTYSIAILASFSFTALLLGIQAELIFRSPPPLIEKKEKEIQHILVAPAERLETKGGNKAFYESNSKRLGRAAPPFHYIYTTPQTNSARPFSSHASALPLPPLNYTLHPPFRLRSRRLLTKGTAEKLRAPSRDPPPAFSHARHTHVRTPEKWRRYNWTPRHFQQTPHLFAQGQ